MNAAPLTQTVHGPNGETEPLDLMDVDAHSGNPWPLYTWMREECPLYKDSNGIWFVSRYADIAAIAMNPTVFTSREGNRPLLPSDESFIHMDGDAHRKRRGLLHKYFVPSAVRKMEDHVRQSVTELIDAVIEDGECDFIEQIAAPLPMKLIGEFTGIPPEMWDMARHQIDVFTGGGNGPEWVTEEVNDAFFTWGALHYDMVDQRMQDPKEDFISLWLNAAAHGVPMNDEQILWEHTMMIVGGSETTRNAISGGLYMIDQRPEQRAKVIAGADTEAAAEEIIRWTTPFVSMSRVLTEDYELHGRMMRAGETVVMLYPPANRDPRVFEHPDEFDVTRTFTRQNRVMSFGMGRHVCIGAHLARLETRVMLEECMRRMPDFRVVGDVTWRRSSFIRGIEKMRIAFTPGPRIGGAP